MYHQFMVTIHIVGTEQTLYNSIEHERIVSVTNLNSYEPTCTPLFTYSVMNRNLNRSKRVLALMNRGSYLYINNMFLI
jgi:hypothetical protein